MSTVNRSPRTLGDVIDRIELMREELLVLQRCLERAEPASEPPQSPKNGATKSHRQEVAFAPAALISRDVPSRKTARRGKTILTGFRLAEGTS